MASLVLHDHSGEDGVAGPTTISIMVCLNDETVSIECRIDDKLTADRIIDAMHVAVIDLIAECEDSVDDEHRSYRRSGKQAGPTMKPVDLPVFADTGEGFVPGSVKAFFNTPLLTGPGYTKRLELRDGQWKALYAFGPEPESRRWHPGPFYSTRDAALTQKDVDNEQGSQP